MGFAQLYYTSCEQGLSGYAGYQFNAATPGVDPQVLREIERFTVYEPPRSCPPEQVAEHPVNLCYSPDVGGVPVLSRVVSSGNDPSGRPGNYFAHSLVSTGSGAGPLPAELWEADFWAEAPVGDPRQAELAELSEAEVGPGPLDRSRTNAWVRRWPPEMVTRLLLAADAAVDDGRPLALVADSGSVAHWVASLCHLLVPERARQLSFATYCGNPDEALVHVVGVPPGSDTARWADRFTVYDPELDPLDRLPAPEPRAEAVAERLARLGTRRTASLWRRARPYASGGERALADWRPVLAAASLLEEGAPRGEDLLMVNAWLPRAVDWLAPDQAAALIHRILDADAAAGPGEPARDVPAAAASARPRTLVAAAEGRRPFRGPCAEAGINARALAAGAEPGAAVAAGPGRAVVDRTGDGPPGSGLAVGGPSGSGLAVDGPSGVGHSGDPCPGRALPGNGASAGKPAENVLSAVDAPGRAASGAAAEGAVAVLDHAALAGLQRAAHRLGGAGGVTERLERVMVRRCLDGIAAGEAAPAVAPVRSESVRAAARERVAALLDGDLGEVRPERAVELLRWARSGGLAPPEASLERYGRRSLAPLLSGARVPHPAARVLMTAHPGVRRGAAAELARLPRERLAALAAGPVGALFAEDRDASTAALRELRILGSGNRADLPGLLSRAVAVRREGRAGQGPGLPEYDVDEELLSRVWGTDRCPRSAVATLRVLRPGLLVDPGVGRWVAEVMTTPPGEGDERTWRELVDEVARHWLRNRLPDSGRRVVVEWSRVRPALVALRAAGDERGPGRMGAVHKAARETHPVVEEMARRLMVRMMLGWRRCASLAEALRDCPEEVFATYCEAVVPRLADERPDTATAVLLYQATGHEAMTGHERARRLEESVLSPAVGAWRRRHVARMRRQLPRESAGEFDLWLRQVCGARARGVFGWAPWRGGRNS
ncbi:GTPase-associated protein 1-related protein [Nocardiopsis sp. FR26]|uniref:GTPase-associated protein 1-related protein n=1 Tax=Nocardiopsis sp. FR26 TaxID=2605987 RepID=UPI00135B4E9D|nr:GTPase-associated protein 1-related protein [Nocardiopsis sp. FR26]